MPLDYLDDITISCTISEHFKHLTEISKKLRYANLKIKPRKCYAFHKSVNYFGHIVTSEGVKTDPKKGYSCSKLDPSSKYQATSTMFEIYLILQTFWETICSNGLTSISSD